MAGVLVVALLAASLLVAPVAEAGGRSRHGQEVRFATFNASLNRSAEGELVADLSSPDDAQAAAVAEIIQRIRPDVLLINEFDYDERGKSRAAFPRSS